MASCGTCGLRRCRRLEACRPTSPRRCRGSRIGTAGVGGARSPTGTIIGSTRYHDIAAGIDRVEIGHTWYAARHQRTHVNTTCKRLLLRHAFETLGCQCRRPPHGPFQPAVSAGD